MESGFITWSSRGHHDEKQIVEHVGPHNCFLGIIHLAYANRGFGGCVDGLVFVGLIGHSAQKYQSDLMRLGICLSGTRGSHRIPARAIAAGSDFIVTRDHFASTHILVGFAGNEFQA